MKLPEHYEKWIEFQLTSEPERSEASLLLEALNDATSRAAKEMFHKLMEDMGPAIEALKVALNYMDRTAISPTGVVELATVEAALRQLKEKGLVE